MTFLLALFAFLLPWGCGAALLYACYAFSARERTSGDGFWILGAGALVGYWLVSLIMRGYSLTSIPFSVATIAPPLLLILAASAWLSCRRLSLTSSLTCRLSAEVFELPPLPRFIFIALLIWLALRFSLLFFEISTRPLFPWEASLQWASQAHISFGLKHMSPLVDAQTWLNNTGTSYFSSSPSIPATLPLLQAWMCVAMGEWNDVLMNLPWWAMLVAMTLATYGFTRSQGLGPIAGLIAAWLVASLPLLNTHVALAGLPDLPLTMTYTLSALALVRWARRKQLFDLFCALLLAFIAATLWSAAWPWLCTLIPAFIAIFFPQWAKKLALLLPVAAILALLVLLQAGGSISPGLAKLSFEIDAAEWLSTLISWENWHLLWIAAVFFLPFLARSLLRNPVAPLTLTLISALMLSIAAIGMPSLATRLFPGTHLPRLLLYWSPLLAIWLLLSWHIRLHQKQHDNAHGMIADA